MPHPRVTHAAAAALLIATSTGAHSPIAALAIGAAAALARQQKNQPRFLNVRPASDVQGTDGLELILQPSEPRRVRACTARASSLLRPLRTSAAWTLSVWAFVRSCDDGPDNTATVTVELAQQTSSADSGGAGSTEDLRAATFELLVRGCEVRVRAPGGLELRSGPKKMHLGDNHIAWAIENRAFEPEPPHTPEAWLIVEQAAVPPAEFEMPPPDAFEHTQLCVEQPPPGPTALKGGVSLSELWLFNHALAQEELAVAARMTGPQSPLGYADYRYSDSG